MAKKTKKVRWIQWNWQGFGMVRSFTPFHATTHHGTNNNTSKTLKNQFNLFVYFPIFNVRCRDKWNLISYSWRVPLKYKLCITPSCMLKIDYCILYAWPIYYSQNISLSKLVLRIVCFFFSNIYLTIPQLLTKNKIK